MRSFFSATTRFSRRYWATTGAGTPWASYRAGPAVETRREQRELGRIGDGEARLERFEAVPGLARRERPIARIAGEEVGRHALPRHVVGRALERGVADRDALRHERIEEPAPRRVALLLLEFAPDGAQFLAQFDAEPDRVVPQDFARSALHHLRADVERSEQRIEGRGRGVLHEAFVEAAMLDPPALALDVPVAHMDLRRLREARELLVRRLGGDDAGRGFAKTAQAHREPALVERMKLHEAGPGLVEHDVVAKTPDPLDDALGVVDRAVIGALFDHRGAERTLALPSVLVRHQRIVANALADRSSRRDPRGESGR